MFVRRINRHPTPSVSGLKGRGAGGLEFRLQVVLRRLKLEHQRSRPLTLPAALRLQAVPLPQRGERDELAVRGGFTLIEVLVAGGLVGMLFLVTIPLLAHVRQVRQEADRRMIAQQEAANVMESVAALAMRSELSPSGFDVLTLSAAAERLPDAALEITLDAATDPLPGDRVTVRVVWTNDTGTRAPPVELSAWFPTKGGE